MHQVRTRTHHGIIGVPSSISRDLLSPASSSVGVPVKTFSSSSPILESSDGVLSKVCGSLVEPESKRQQWACHGCGQSFHRDATIFLGPTVPSTSTPLGPSVVANREKQLEGGSQDHFCRQCYSDRFSMGACVACSKPVLGSTKEDGKFVKASGGDIWHGRCWKCVECGEDDQEKVSLGMTGLPTCEVCFDEKPGRRKHVEAQASPQRGRHDSPTVATNALSGSANRSGMGATIAELSKKFGKPVSTQLPPSGTQAHSINTSPVLRPSHSRSNSVSGRIRPITAPFSGNSFNLAAFQPSTTALGRGDSRSRSVSPHKRLSADSVVCSRCSRGPFDGPEKMSSEVTMVAIPKEGIQFHSECFLCAICSKRMDDANRSFVRLKDATYAHPQCAPPAVESRPVKTALPASGVVHRPSSSSSSSSTHATHQRETRPSISNDAVPARLPTSYLSGGITSESAHPQGPKRFQSSAGAAPPTRSTLIQQRPNSQPDVDRGLASLAVTSCNTSGRTQASGKFSKLGGMNACGGCNYSVSGLEGVPGPRGMKWHKKCLVCSSKSKGKLCGKLLDSSARVDEQGQVRCRQCFDCEHSKHPLRV
ncbi:hypothetical protein CBS101457_004836 [Exobasidium rhododendri]|nr:hypothetical protein CBS101457_004836 [Exobasidium rhododendri]